MGSNIGVTIRIPATDSMNMPIKINIRFATSRKIYLLLAMELMPFPRRLDTPELVSSQLNAPDAPTTIMTRTVFTMAPPMMLPMFSRFISLYQNAPAKNP